MLCSILTAIQIFTKDGAINYQVLYQHSEFIVVKTSDEKIAAVFYGTDTCHEWLDNLKFGLLSKESFPYGWYSQAVNTNNILNANNLAIDYAIGYSRGAAIAVIYSYLYDIQAVGISTPNISKKLLYWKNTPVLIGSLNDPIRFVPVGYRKPGNYRAIYMETGGHYWHKGKFKIEITEHLGDSQPDPTGSKFGA